MGKLKSVFAVLGLLIVMGLLVAVGFRIGYHYANQQAANLNALPTTPTEGLETAVVTELRVRPNPVASEPATAGIPGPAVHTVVTVSPTPVATLTPTPTATTPTDEKALANAAVQKALNKLTPTAAPVAKSPRFYTVQIRSSYNKAIADEFESRFKKLGYDVIVTSKDIKGVIWYRVNLGRYSAREGAEELRTELIRDHNLKDAIIQFY